MSLKITPSEPKTIVKSAPITSKVHFIQKVIKGETYLVMAQSAVELEDEFSGLYYTASAKGNLFLMPPYEPNVLLNLVQSNNILNQCVEAMEVNIDGTGHEFVAIKEGGTINKEEQVAAEAFFNEPYPNEHFIAMRRKSRRFMESVGYGFLEVLRALDGTLVGLRNIETQHLRLVKLEEPIQVQKKILRNGKEVTLTLWERERKFAQTIALKQYVYYREYGSTRQVHRETGQWETKEKPVPPDMRGTELLIFGINPDTTTPYFVPRWINQLPSVIGSRNAEEQNLQFLDAGGMPPAIIFIQGGAVMKESSDQLKAYLSGLNKNKNRAVVVEVMSSQGSLDTQGKVDVKVERFGAEQAKDAMFMKYDEATEEHVRLGFRLPPLFIGKAEDYNFATAKTSYMVAEAQVFAPERTDFDEVINKTIMKELGFKTIKFKSKPITLTDIDAQLKGLELSKDITTRETFIKEINTATGMALEVDENAPVPGQLPGEPKPGEEEEEDPRPAERNEELAELELEEQAEKVRHMKLVKGAKPQAKTAIELIDLAYDYATSKGIVQKRELSPERTLLVQHQVQKLDGEEKVAFDTLVSQYLFADTDAAFVDLTRSAVAHAVKRNPYHAEDGKFTTKDKAGTGSDGGHAKTTSAHEALESVLAGKKTDIKRSQVKDFLQESTARKDDPDLTDLYVEGMTIFGGNGLGIKRADMPQIPDSKRDLFMEELKKQGIAIKEEDVSPLSLSPAQSEISSRKVGQMLPNHETILSSKSRIYVSEDNYVLDGHHRWALASAVSIDKPKTTLPVTRMMVDHKQALKVMLEFGEKYDIARRSLSDAKKRELLRKYGWDV